MVSKRKAQDIAPPSSKRKVVSTTKSVVASSSTSVVESSKKESEGITWKIIDQSLLVAKYKNGTTPTYAKPRKIASFDMDSNLIKTASGRVHAKSETDWVWWDKKVPIKLRELHSEGYTVIIFTNQGGIKLDKPGPKLNTFKLKVAAILADLDVPLTLYAATENDKYRKPRVGMWDEMMDEYDIDIHGLNKEGSYLVGDAAGRDGDFSASDRYVAANIGIRFYTPEEFFLGQQPKPYKDVFDPMTIATTQPTNKPKFTKRSNLDVVIMVGSPGAGKSTFVKKNLVPLGYERVNQDILKTKEKCLEAATRYLQSKKSVAIDATNADIGDRERWIALAKKFSIPVRCVHLTAPIHIAKHNDACRGLGGPIVNPEGRKIIPGMVFNKYKSNFTEPSLTEGFLDITKVDFEWEGTDAERKVWAQYWT